MTEQTSPDGPVTETWERCSAPSCDGAALPERDHCLAHVDDQARANALRRFGRGRSLDIRGVSLDAALWGTILEAAPLDPLCRRRLSGLRLNHAKFECDVDLDESVFARDARFESVRFAADVSFRGAVIQGQAEFSDTVFEGTSVFDGARLQGPTWFARARFAGAASFRSVSFGGQCWFPAARFDADAVFDETVFARHAGFEQASFGCHTYFAAASFEADGSFVEATFARPPDFEGAVFKGVEGLPEVAERKQVKWWGPPLALWAARAQAAIIDLAIPAVLVTGTVVAARFCQKIQNGFAAGVVIVSGAVAVLWFLLRNLTDEGDTGQSLGKRRVGLRLLDERTRRPVGRFRAVSRYLLHLLDSAPLLAGWLWPLRDEKKRTFADILSGTVVVVVGDNWHRANAERPPERVPVGGG